MNPSSVWEISGAVLALATLPGTIELLALTAASLFWKAEPLRDSASVQNIAVVIPAHNEEANIWQCLESLQACEFGANLVQLIVVADNCTDETGPMAEQMGARVLTRNDTQHQGKSFALSFAFARLLCEPFDTFIVIDADTLVEKNFINCFADRFSGGAPAIQCRNLSTCVNRSIRARVMNLAMLAFNVIRPRGRSRLGFSAGLFGNGFGLSRHVLETVPYAPDSIAEDLEYHVSLVQNGQAVVFEDRTTVRSRPPQDDSAASIQRSRWEGGRFRVLFNCIPKLFLDISHGKLSCLEVLFDLLTLPLAFHVVLLALAAIAFPGMIRGYAYCAMSAVGFHVITAIITVGSKKDVVVLILAPFYIIWKLTRLPLILKAARKNTRWIRTPRRKEQKEKIP